MRFEYRVSRGKVGIVVAITFVKPAKQFMCTLGAIVFADPDEFEEEYELWKASMQWNPMHVLMED